MPVRLAAAILLPVALVLGAPPEDDERFEAGVATLVEASESWREERGCVTCHTNGWALAAQPVIAPGSKEVAAGRAFAQGYLVELLEEGESSAVEGLVATTAFLAMSDARTGAGLHPTTRRGLDRAWERLDESGTWEDWLQCNWPPFESDAQFGPALVLVALAEVDEVSKLTARDRAGARRLTTYLRETPPRSLHDKAMRVWAQASTRQERKAWRGELLAAQSEDGGWSMASLSGPGWKREDGSVQRTTSEAYPTAFVTYVLLRTGSKNDEDAVVAGLAWLREHQHEEGNWTTRSPRRDGRHYISRSATAFALMALREAAPR